MKAYKFNEVASSIRVLTMKQLEAKDTYHNDGLDFF